MGYCSPAERRWADVGKVGLLWISIPVTTTHAIDTVWSAPTPAHLSLRGQATSDVFASKGSWRRFGSLATATMPWS